MLQTNSNDKISYQQPVQVLDSLKAKQKQKIQGYQFLQTLGEGTFGKVKAAIHSLSGQKVAIKIIDKMSIEDERDRARVRKQIQILKIMRHPNIVQLYETIETNQCIYLIMEYVGQGQLFTLLSEEIRLNEKASGRIFIQLMNAVQYLHHLGIAHRDLKPQNILLDEDLNVKLVDFGLSNFIKKNQLLETACGSPCYAPPEMLQGKNYDGKIGDVWSMGIIFYGMICGALPFEEKTTKKLYKKVIEGFFVIPSDISLSAIEVIQSMLVTNPSKRIRIPELRKLKFFRELEKIEARIIGIIIGFHPMPIEYQVIQKMKDYLVFDQSVLEQQIKQNVQTPLTALYYLLQRKTLRDCGSTNLDLQIFLESHEKYKEQYGFFPEKIQNKQIVEQIVQQTATNCAKNLSFYSKSPETSQRQLINKDYIKPGIKKAQFQKRFHSKVKILNRKGLTKQKRKPLSTIKTEKNQLNMTKNIQEKHQRKDIKFYRKRIQDKGQLTSRLHTQTFNFKSTSRSKDSIKQREKFISQRRNKLIRRETSQVRIGKDKKLALNLWGAYFQRPLEQSIRKVRLSDREKSSQSGTLNKTARRAKNRYEQQESIFVENMRRLKVGFLNLSKNKKQREPMKRERKEGQILI